MPAIALNQPYCHHPDTVFVETDNEVLMLHFETGTYHWLNEVGSFIWKELAHPRTIAEVSKAVEDTFEVDPARCLEDTHQFIEAMIEDGLLRPAEPPAARDDHSAG
ncbi:MAG: hypothetical protein RLZZ09_2973 [Pseudomonadota bacterium]